MLADDFWIERLIRRSARHASVQMDAHPEFFQAVKRGEARRPRAPGPLAANGEPDEVPLWAILQLRDALTEMEAHARAEGLIEEPKAVKPRRVQ